MRFLIKLWQCFFTWKVKPEESSLGRSQVVLAQSLGYREKDPGLSNRALAKVVASLYHGFGLPLVLQWEVADCIPELPKVGVIRKHRREGEYLDTYEVLAQSAEICKAHGWQRAILVSHPDHCWRVKKTAERLGFKVTVPDTSLVPYDPESCQPWTRTRAKFLLRELPARLFCLLKGWI